jgi:acyl-CoA synthetase (AMP-forming)/AMP-acid ligase II
MLSHANLAANASAIVECLRLKPEDSVVSPLPFAHAYGSSVLHTHLSVGARIVIEQNHAFPYAVVDTLVRERPTGFSGVASTYALFLSRVSLGQYDLTSLRYVTQAGGPMAPALARRVLDAFPRAQLFVMYGQTEATARLTYLPPGQLGVKPGSVGIAVPGTTIQVRREDRTVAAVGEPGDVWASGPGVMQGYWRDPQATAAVLQDGWLKTGDVGHLDADGYLFLHGRRSDMIKTGAHRVHPLDVEEVIAELPAVAEAAVVGVDDELLGQVIKAFIVPVEPQALDVEAVRAHCRKRLPAYKRPRHIEMVACVPRTLSGKVRRVELAGCSTSWGEGAHG